MAEAHRRYDNSTRNLGPKLQQIQLELASLGQKVENLDAPALLPPSQHAVSPARVSQCPTDHAKETKDDDLTSDIINTRSPPQHQLPKLPPLHLPSSSTSPLRRTDRLRYLPGLSIRLFADFRLNFYGKYCGVRISHLKCACIKDTYINLRRQWCLNRPDDYDVKKHSAPSTWFSTLGTKFIEW